MWEALPRHTVADLRLGGSVVVTVAVAVLLQPRANTHTLKHRRAGSSRPPERQDRPPVCVHFDKRGGAVFVARRRNDPTQKLQTGNRWNYFYGDALD